MVVFTKQFSAQPIKNSSRVPLSLRSRKKISSRVPAYQNPQIIVGYCDYLFKPLPWRGSTDGAARGESSSLRLSRVVTEEDVVKGVWGIG